LSQEQYFFARLDLHTNMARMGCSGTRQDWEDAALAFLAKGKARTLKGTPVQTWVSVQHELKLAAEHGTPVSQTSRIAYMQMGSAQRAIDAAGNSAKAAEAEWARREALLGKRKSTRLSFRVSEDAAPPEVPRDDGTGNGTGMVSTVKSSANEQPEPSKEREHVAPTPAHPPPDGTSDSEPSIALSVWRCCSPRRRHFARHSQARVLPNTGPAHQTAWGDESLAQCDQLSEQPPLSSPLPGEVTETEAAAAAAARQKLPDECEVTIVRRFSNG